MRLLGTGDASAISTYVTEDPHLDPARVRTQVDALAARCRERGIRFDMRPKVKGGLIEPYYTPGTALPGRCLYPFLNARISFSGKVYFCPFIRIEVGDLTDPSLEEIWNRRGAMSRCGKGWCRMDRSPSAAAAAKWSCSRSQTLDRSMLGTRTLFVNPPARRRYRLYETGPVSGTRGSARHDQTAVHSGAGGGAATATWGVRSASSTSPPPDAASRI